MLFSVPKASRFSKIVLASASPRRSEILREKGGITDLVVCPSSYEEESKGKFDRSDVYNYITGIARGKVEQAVQIHRDKWDKSVFDRALFIGTDTVVLLEGTIFEKPESREDALRMLKSLRGKTHQVCSGVVLLVANNSSDAAAMSEMVAHVFHETSDVNFASVSDDALERYVDTGEPMDKAGGFGIQGWGAQLVEGIVGDYYNVMGFPLYRFCQELNNFIEQLDSS